MIITDFLLLNSQNYPEGEAIVELRNTDRICVTWHYLYVLTNHIAFLITKRNIKKGDKVGILLHNSYMWLPVYFAVLKIGAVAVLLNYNNSMDEIEYCIELTDCQGIIISIAEETYTASLRSNAWIMNIEEAVALNNKVNCEYTDTLVSISPEDIASIYFSSGTTGRSKAIQISHTALLSAAQMELSHHNQHRNDRFLCMSPLYHAGSKIHWFGSLLVAGTIVMANTSNPMSIVDIIERERITIAFLLVPQIQDILAAIDIGEISLKNCKIDQWRLMHSGAQSVPKTLIEKWHEKFWWQSYDTNYGLTEATGPGCIHLGVENIHKAGSIGKPDPNWEAIIVANGQEVQLGEIGEIILKGPGIMEGYYKDDIATNEAVVNGWLHTGDMAYSDEDGFLYIVDRKKDVIISGGENIYPIQIENHIRRLDCVKDVAVVGVTNARMGELVAAVIEVKDGENCSKKDLLRHCSYLPPIQRPYKYVFNKIIRNSVGKPDKKEMMRSYFCKK